MTEPTDPGAAAWRNSLRLLPFLRRRGWLALASAAAVVQAVLLVLTPHVVQRLTDAALAAEGSAFVGALTLAVIIAGVALPMNFLRSYAQTLYWRGASSPCATP